MPYNLYLDEYAVWNVVDAVRRKLGFGFAGARTATPPHAADAQHHRRCWATAVVLVTAGVVVVARGSSALLGRFGLSLDFCLCQHTNPMTFKLVWRSLQLRTVIQFENNLPVYHHFLLRNTTW